MCKVLHRLEKALPVFVAVVAAMGVILAICAAAFASNVVWGPVFGSAVAAVTIVMTVVIWCEQKLESARSHKLLIAVKEQTSRKDYGVDGEMGVVSSESQSTARKPSYEAEVIDALKNAGVDLKPEELQWDRKIPESGKPGNYGWFVRSSDKNSVARWFVRKANGISVRKAMPQDFLDALREREGISPKSIQNDFQVKNHGLASWYARTYSGKLYRVWRANRSGGKDIQIELVESEWS